MTFFVRRKKGRQRRGEWRSVGALQNKSDDSLSHHSRPSLPLAPPCPDHPSLYFLLKHNSIVCNFTASIQANLMVEWRRNNEWKQNYFIMPMRGSICSLARKYLPKTFKAMFGKMDTACIIRLVSTSPQASSFRKGQAFGARPTFSTNAQPIPYNVQSGGSYVPVFRVQVFNRAFRFRFVM